MSTKALVFQVGLTLVLFLLYAQIPQEDVDSRIQHQSLSMAGPEIDFKHKSDYCIRKDERRRILCKFMEKDCVRYGPVEELAYFWMICALYSPNQANTELLYDLHEKFLSYAKLFGFQTQTIEVVFPGQEYKATQPNREPYELQYKADWVFNMRENLVNVGSKNFRMIGNIFHG